MFFSIWQGNQVTVLTAHSPRPSAARSGYLLFWQEIGSQHRRGGGGHLSEGHDVLKGDVGLGARVHQLRL